jgi:hypothetical protein
VGEFVHQHMPEFGIVAGKGNDHSVLQYFGEAAHAFFDQFQGYVGLRKIIGRIVENDRDLEVNLHTEILLEQSVTILKYLFGKNRKVLAAGVEVDIEMLGTDNLELEILVLNLVLAKLAEQHETT